MPSFRPIRIKPIVGLKDDIRHDDGERHPGSAVVAKNVVFSRRTLRRRNGKKHLLSGEKDAVKRGGPVGGSLYVHGSTFHLDHKDLYGYRSPVLTNYGHQPFQARQGYIVVPEDGRSSMILNPQAGSTNWAIEFTLWTDDLSYLGASKKQELSSVPITSIVMSKGWAGSDLTGNSAHQWRVVLKNANATSGAEQKYYLALEIIETNGTVHEFRYELAGNPSSLIRPHTRMWFAFEFDEALGEITSYYLNESLYGTLGALSSTQSVPANLTTNGNLIARNAGCPLRIGGNEKLGISQVGFNGSVGELKFYYDGANGSASLHPSWNVNYVYYQVEQTDAEVTLTTQTTDLDLYHSFAHHRVSDGEYVDPRYTNGSAGSNRAWLTGANAAWVSASGKLGTGGLQFFPELDHYRALVHSDDSGAGAFNSEFATGDPGNGVEVFGRGLRVLNGDQYMEIDETAAPSKRRFPREFSGVIAIKTPPSIPTGWGQRMYLWHLSSVLRGNAENHDYRVVPWLSLTIEVTGSSGSPTYVPRLRVFNQGAGSVHVTLTGTTTLAPDTEYSIGFGVHYGLDTDRHVYCNLYVDGIKEDEDTTLTLNPGIDHDQRAASLSTKSTSTGDNANDLDGRDKCFPMAIGCRFRTTELGATPLRYTMMYGATATIGSVANGVARARRFWGFHKNIYTKGPNDGVPYIGFEGFRGVIGRVHLFRKMLSEAEQSEFSNRAPTVQELAAFGDLCPSSWDFEEGAGDVAFDKGALGNHIRFQSRPQVRAVADGIHRETKGRIRGFWQVRTRTPREGIDGDDIYALSPGSLNRLVKDGSGNPYFEAISSRVQSWLARMPSCVQYQDFTYIAHGEGPPLRVTRDKVSYAGIANPVGQFQQDFNGTVEADRDGTFQIVQADAANAGETVFDTDGTWLYLITYFDPVSATESAPSTIIPWKVQSGSGFGAKALTLTLLPRPQDPHASRYRIYRTRENGGVFFLLRETNIVSIFVDSDDDSLLEDRINDSSFNAPPPLGANLMVPFGTRMLYSGVKSDPASVWPSISGKPEICPPRYKVLVTQGESKKVTAIHVINDRAVVWLDDSAYILTDNRTDFSTFAINRGLPVQRYPLHNSEGCISHHSVVFIEGVGILFANRRGVYVTDLTSWKYIGRDVEGTWETLDLSTAENWIAVDWLPHDQYILFCSTGATEGLDRALVYDYKVGSWSTLFLRMPITYAQVVRDSSKDKYRLYVSDLHGQLYDYDPYDDDIHNDGGYRGSFTVTSGTVVSVDVSNNKRIQLVDDNSLPTTADGLAGCPVTIGGEDRTIISNDDEYVVVDEAFTVNPSVGSEWLLGSIAAEYVSPLMDLGDPSVKKQVDRLYMNMEPVTDSTVNVATRFDRDSYQEHGGENAGANDITIGHPEGIGRRFQYRVHNDAPDKGWEVVETLIEAKPRGRGSRENG